MRAAWTAQEFLTTFVNEIGEVALIPATGGTFNVKVGGDVVWSRTERGRFPELKELNSSFEIAPRPKWISATQIAEA